MSNTAAKLLTLDCGCQWQYNPQTFIGGERQFKCAHNRVWLITAERDSNVRIAVEDKTPTPDTDS